MKNTQNKMDFFSLPGHLHSRLIRGLSFGALAVVWFLQVPGAASGRIYERFYRDPVIDAFEDIGQDRPAVGVGAIPIVCDVHQYEADSGKTALEIVYALRLLKAECPEIGSLGTAILSIGVRLSDPSLRVVDEIRSRKVLTLSEADRAEGSITFLNIERFETVQDTLLVTVWAEDSASGKYGSVSRPVRIRAMGGDLSLSDLYFTGSPRKAGGGHSAFEKHGVFLIPNPNRCYDASYDSSAAWVYFEINHLASGPGANPFYSVHIGIEDSSGVVKKVQDRGPIRAGASNTSRIEKISLKGLPAGSYTLAVTVTEQGTGRSQIARRVFWLKHTSTTEVFDGITSDRDRIEHLVRLIATPEEKKMFSQLTGRGLQEFFLRFWERRDPVPQTPENEFMIEYLRRYSLAENSFKGGAESDMGRVFILYGPPVDSQREFSTIGYSKPVEIWYYGIEGTVEFVFVDRLEDGLYRLVHSTMKDEYSNPNWMDDYR